MPILFLIAPLAIGGLLNKAIKPNARFVYKLAIYYICLALLLCAGYWVYYFAGIRAVFFMKMLSLLLSLGAGAGHLIMGYLLIYILFDPQREGTDKYPPAKITRLMLWGISILTANTFLIATVGKAENFTMMSSFFNTSGYAIWFLYFIMIAESFGALGILFHFKLKTGPLATAGLMLIMIGALYTHNHNKDPFSDSYAAISQFIILSLMLVIYYIETQNNTITAQHDIMII